MLFAIHADCFAENVVQGLITIYSAAGIKMLITNQYMQFI